MTEATATATAAQAPSAPAAPVAAPAAIPAAPAAAAPAIAPAKPAEVPVEYAAFALPEGAALIPEIETEFKTVAKDLKLSQESAQRVVNIGSKFAQKLADQQAEALTKARSEWGAQSRGDPEIGGQAFDANLAMAGKVFQKFGTPELKALLDQSGLGDHPELVRWAYRVGRAIGDDALVTGSPPNTQAANSDLASRAAAKLYPNQPSVAAA